MEVVIAMDVGAFLRGNFAKHLHADDAVDEEDQSDEDGYPRKGLRWELIIYLSIYND